MSQARRQGGQNSAQPLHSAAGLPYVPRETASLPFATRLPLPWYVHVRWRVADTVTWPWQARQLRKAGFVRTGWRRWIYPG